MVEIQRFNWRLRLKVWFRRLVLGDLILRIVDNRKAFAELAAKFAENRNEVLARLDRLEACVNLVSHATSKGLDLLARAIEDIPGYIPFSWREYECVEYAVSKFEKDEQARLLTPQEQQFKEILGWCRMYCHEHDWTPPPTERLTTLIEARLLHAAKKLSVVREMSRAV